MASITLGSIYGKWHKWRVLDDRGQIPKGRLWLCECCGCCQKKEIPSYFLKPGRYPVCRNCCRLCGRTRQETPFKTTLAKTCFDCRKKRIDAWRAKNGFKIWKHDYDCSNKNKPLYRQRREEKIQQSPHLFLAEQLKRRRSLHRNLDKAAERRTGRKRAHPERHVVVITATEICALWDVQGGLCALTGMPMTHRFHCLRSASIDRVDSTKCYELGNVQLVCRWVNMAKGEETNEHLLEILAEFKDHFAGWPIAASDPRANARSSLA